jgi:CHAT domain-containing protein
LNRATDGRAALNEAEALLASGSVILHAELAFARGNCSFNTPLLARQYFETAAELASGKDPFIQASALGNIGYLLGEEGRRDEAIDWFQKVVPLAQAANSPLLEEKTLGNLGDSYVELGDYKRAIDNSERAERIASETGRLEDQQSWLIDLGVSYAALTGNYPGKAESSYQKALTIALQLHDVDIARRALHDLTQLAIKQHDLAKAETEWKQEIAVIGPSAPLDLDAMLDEAEIAQGHHDDAKAIRLFESIVQNPKTTAPRRARASSQLGKIYWAQNNPVLAERMFRQGLDTIETALSRIKEQYRVAFMDLYPYSDTYINFLVSRGKPSKALQLAEHIRAIAQGAPLNKPHDLNIAGIQSILKARHQIVLDYQVTDDETYLWVITPRDIRIFHLPSHPELHSLIDAYSNAIQEQRGIDDSFGGQQLYKALIQPAEKLIPPGSHVLIVPSKVLCLLNFETLIVPGSKPHYWIEDVEVQNISSLLVQPSGPKRVSSPGATDLLLMGAPEEVNPEFPPLKHAGDEIASVRSHFAAPTEKVISGADATPEAYKASNPELYRFIHFVTHGIANEKAPLESAIVLSGNSASYKLYARDIIATPLRADLVTISACYGAGRRWYVSQGVVGLGWAFMHAGAHQVIAALWEVDDASTPKLMDDFYSALHQGKTAADALRLAKLNLLNSDNLHRRPYYWGSLQLYTHF